jgi:hypothetical protein
MLAQLARRSAEYELIERLLTEAHPVGRAKVHTQVDQHRK